MRSREKSDGDSGGDVEGNGEDGVKGNRKEGNKTLSKLTHVDLHSQVNKLI